MNWHLLPLSEISKLLKTNPSGLDSVIASEQLIAYGKNSIEDKKKKTIFQMLLHQLTDFMIVVLIVVAIVSGILGEVIDALIILAIIILNATVGFFQEYRSEKIMEALKNMIPTFVRVLRNDEIVTLLASDLVPGDVVLLEAGNSIPADVRFIETHQIKVDESTLTGESNNVEKNNKTLPNGDYPLGDRINMGFKGTYITHGRGSAYVVATGMNTELGLIAKMIQTEEKPTPLQKRLTLFGKKLSLFIILICILIFVLGWWRGENASTMLLTTISLAVAAIPEALPALIIIALAFGAKRLAKSNALIRKLPAVETLGSVTYICTDKTGTLTHNKMTVQEIYETSNRFSESIFTQPNGLLYAMALNNDVVKEKKGKWLGDSTEVALAQFASNKKIEKTAIEKTYPRIGEIPFDSSRKLMTTFHQTENGIIAITKGAAELLLKNIVENQKQLLPELESKVNEMAEKGYRVIGYAIKKIDRIPDLQKNDTIETSLTLIGFAGMIDPPREEAKQAVAECKQAGITTIMITGDHKLTAKAIAIQLGIITSDDDLVMNGSKLASLTEQQFNNMVEKTRVYARVNPEQKLKIINALHNKGQIVAMTGDGVNDAPALKNADIGIAMGINGTEVSKEASHLILLDDNFATIAVAVKHGRKIFDNILKFIKYIMTGNSGEIWAIFLAPFFLLPIPLLAIHILWINLVTDGLLSLALASEPAERNIMKRPPRNPKESIFSNGMATHILWVGFLMGITTLGIQIWAINNETSHWQTMVFTVLCFSQMGHLLAIRSERESLFKIGIFSNQLLLALLIISILLQLLIIYFPFCNIIFKTQPLSVLELMISIAVSSIVFWAVEMEKLLFRFKNKNQIRSIKLS